MTFSKKTVAGVSTLVVLGGLLGLWAYSDLWLGTYLANFVHAHAVTLLCLTGGLAGAGGLFAVALRRGDYDIHVGWASGAVAAATAGVVAAIGFGWYGDYLGDRAVALASGSDTTAAHDTYAERPALDQVKKIIDGDKGDLRGDLSTVRRLADIGAYHALLTDTKFMGQGGYTGLSVRKDGESNATQCTVPEESDLRLGGWFNGSLEREISHIERGLIIDTDDAYGLCDDGDVSVVVPVKKLQGFYPAVQVPAGVVVYDTATGDVDLLDEVEAGDIPGPVYPLSLAAMQREALRAYGDSASFANWARGRMGYTLSTEDGDPNGSNPAEIQLVTDSGHPAYVSPMAIRSRSGSTRIAAVAQVSSGEVKAGEYNDIVLHTYASQDRRPTNAVVDDTIRAHYSDLQQWANGLTVFEIVPTADQEWVATLGYERAVTFRVRISADGTTTLETPEGEVIESRDADGTVVSGGNPQAGEDVVVDESGLKLSELSDRQLAELLDQISSEVLDRARKGDSES